MYRLTSFPMLARLRGPVLLVVDCLAWIAAMFAACTLREETANFDRVWAVVAGKDAIAGLGALALAGVAAATMALVGAAVDLHRGRSAIGTFDEIQLLVGAVLVGGIPVFALNALVPDPVVPRAVPVIAVALALLLTAAPRVLWRAISEALLHWQLRRAEPVRVIIMGAGNAGRQLVDSMIADVQREWLPVAFVDDDPQKRKLRYRGVRVMGTLDDVQDIADEVDAAIAVVAIPSGGTTAIRRARHAAGDAIHLKVVPHLSELMHGVSVSAVRDIEPADLLGRHPVETDVASIAGFLRRKRVLVVGAGGSIGSELARQLANFSPSELLLLDRDESALHALLLSMAGRADLEARNIILADIREAARIHQVMEMHRPDVVFHAAALKHVNMLERHAAEAVKSNVIGTLNVLQAASRFGVGTFVNISTDKAADPVNVLGYTKRIAEGLTADFGAHAVGNYLSVRFGNVLGTRGSVLKTFASQVARGGPITVTHRDVTRYFMTIDEAVQLVIQAAAIGRNGEALVLDMGDPVRIRDVAQQMARAAGRPGIDIVYTGLKPGEKLHEALFGQGEFGACRSHPLICHVPVPSVERDVAYTLIHPRNDDTIAALRRVVGHMRADLDNERGRQSDERHPRIDLPVRS